MADDSTIAGGAIAGRAPRAAQGIAEFLSLAAAPTFAVMALLTGLAERGQADFLCLSAHEALPLSGMALMYLMMSAFHLTPWLRLFSHRGHGMRLS